MLRREFIAGLAGTATWPFAARAQDRQRLRTVGVLLPTTADNTVFQARVGALLQGLGQLDWAIGRNMRIDIRWAGTGAAEIRRHATELVALAPDVIVAFGGSTINQLMQATRTVPIVFPVVVDPVGSGYVESLGRPGGNVTGFMTFEFSMGGKWLELLKEIAPGVTRAGVLRDPIQGGGNSVFAAIQTAAPGLRMEVSPISMRDPANLERAIETFAKGGPGGLITPGSAFAISHRDLITKLAARHKLPTIYNERTFVAIGGLCSYGPDQIEQFRRAAGYVDRILKGEKPSDLPVQAPTKYELVINLKIAKTLGLAVPPALLARADEVIE